MTYGYDGSAAKTFGARYYSSALGRFLTPGWSSPGAVPYADLTNPQSVNLYAYAGNNPVTLPPLPGGPPLEATRPLLNNVGYDDRIEGANWGFPVRRLNEIRVADRRDGCHRVPGGDLEGSQARPRRGWGMVGAWPRL